jgi:hypothetical protein
LETVVVGIAVDTAVVDTAVGRPYFAEMIESRRAGVLVTVVRRLAGGVAGMGNLGLVVAVVGGRSRCSPTSQPIP